MNHTPKAALKTHALQTLRAGEGRQKLASAFGVRASLAPLFLRRSLKMRFKGLMREHLREILSSVLSPLLRRGERKKTRSETSSQPANDFDYCRAACVPNVLRPGVPRAVVCGLPRAVSSVVSFNCR